MSCNYSVLQKYFTDVREENAFFTDFVIFAFIKQGSLRRDLK